MSTSLSSLDRNHLLLLLPRCFRQFFWRHCWRVNENHVSECLAFDNNFDCLEFFGPLIGYKFIRRNFEFYFEIICFEFYFV